MKGLNLYLCVAHMDSLNKVSMIAYGQDIPGLTVKECEELERLCDKAFEGYEGELNKAIREVKQERE